jgi:hypothetical protein
MIKTESKYFCDKCGEETPIREFSRLELRVAVERWEVDLCDKCIAPILAHLHDLLPGEEDA